MRNPIRLVLSDKSRQLTYFKQLTEVFKLFIKSMYELECYLNNEKIIQFKVCSFKDTLARTSIFKDQQQ